MADFETNIAFQLTFFINHYQNGWSESWYLLDQSRDYALDSAAPLLEARSWILGANCVIEWAEIKTLTGQRNVQAAIGDPVGPLAMWAPPDNDKVSLLFRFQTDRGRYANHHIRGFADDETTDNRWIRHPLALPAGPFPRPADPNLATKDDLWRYFLTLFRAKTCHAEYVGNLPTFGDVWRLTSWREPIYRHVSGLPFSSSYQRVSGEWWPWESAPDFSFCGTAMGVQRTCRDIDAYPYVDGQKVVFRTYFSLPGASVFPHPNIFFGTYRDKEIDNQAAPGELTGPKKTLSNPAGVWEYNGGLAAGIAPGVAPTGPPSRFLGMDPIPFNPFPDTPPGYRPLCDMPVINSIRVRLNDNSVDVADAYEIIADETTIDMVQTDVHKVFFGAKIPAGSSLVHLADLYSEDLSGATYTRTGNVYTVTANGTNSIDGVTIGVGRTILFNPADEDGGILEITAVDGIGNLAELQRVASLDSDDEAIPGFLVMVTEGTNQHDSLWMLTTDGPITLNTTALVFEKICGVQDLWKVKTHLTDPSAAFLGDKLASDVVVMTVEPGGFGDRIRMTIPDARPTVDHGLVSNGTQYFGGDKFYVGYPASVVSIGNPNPDVGISDNIFSDESRVDLFAGKQIGIGGNDHECSASIRITQGFASGVFVLGFSPTNPFTAPSSLMSGLGFMLAGDLYTRHGNLPVMALNQPLGVPPDPPLGLQPSYADYFIGTYDTHLGDSGFLFDGSLVVNGLICRVGNSGATIWGNDQTQVTYGATTGAGADWLQTYNFWTSF